MSLQPLERRGFLLDPENKQQPELWLPTSTMHVTVENGEVRITESMTMEKRKVKTQAGFADCTSTSFFKNGRGQ